MKYVFLLFVEHCALSLDSVLKLMSAVTGDRRFEEAQNDFPDRKEGNSMIDVLSRIEDRGRADGISIGRAEGIIGTARDFGASDSDIVSRLVSKLNISADDAHKMLKNFA